MDNKQKTKDRVLSLFALMLLPIIAAVMMGAIWGFIDWLRTYGSGISPFPYFDNANFQTEPFRTHAPSTLLSCVENIINWYNLNFRGGTRFGSGIGWIAGAFVAMGLFKRKHICLRLLAGTIAGAMIGTRSVLMLGSGIPLFIVGLVLGAAIGACYMVLTAGSPAVSPLPKACLPEVS